MARRRYPVTASDADEAHEATTVAPDTTIHPDTATLEHLSDPHLLALLLHPSTPDRPDAITQAHHLLRSAGSLLRLTDPTDLLPHLDLTPAQTTTLRATRELATRLTRHCIHRRIHFHHPEAVAAYLTLRYRTADQEILGALYLDARSRLLADRELFRGTLTRVAVEPRQILKEALRRNAHAFLLFHTHPSGDPSPSQEDIELTRRMKEAGELLGIEMADHLILGEAGRWVSMRGRGW